MYWFAELYRTTPGKKFVTAVTGIVLFTYVFIHTLGNLQVYLGPGTLNAYARLVHSVPGFIPAVEVVIALAAALHIISAVQLTVINRKARPVGYALHRYREAGWAGRTMIWSGAGIAAFTVYHLLHLTFGSVHPDFVPGDVYANVIIGLYVLPASVVYSAAVALLGLHLYHGLWSVFQTLGWSHPLYDSWRRVFATVIAVLITAANVSIPVAVLLHLIS
jgi:succinate dehydrogenase / fumarate reductase cytochrome b subunit